MIEVSPSATKALKAFFEEKNIDSPVRVFLQSGGCGGPSLRLSLDEAKGTDNTSLVEGITYLIDAGLSQVSGEVKVDFVDDGYQQGFLITAANPLPGAGEGCSCGGSCSC